jgi:hypothetical protein
MNWYQYIVWSFAISLFSCSGQPVEEIILVTGESEIDKLEIGDSSVVIEEEKSTQLDTFGRAIIEQQLRVKRTAGN